MRRIEAKRADAIQLREELSGVTGVAVKEEGGKVFVEYDDSSDAAVQVNGVRVDRALRDHFPRSLVAAIAAVDFEGASTVADLKARNIQLRNRIVVVLRAMLRQDEAGGTVDAPQAQKPSK